MLEGMKHEFSTMVTLTYEDKYLPLTEDGLPTLSIRDHQLFLKGLRRALEPHKIRYYMVGEYGENTFRPHYHYALFGFPPCDTPNFIPRGKCPCRKCTLIRSVWQKGIIDVGYSRVEKDSAQYVAGYVTKKMTKKEDPRLKGRLPEFSRMSLKPGIGYGFVDDIVSFLTTTVGCESIVRAGDVPMSLNHGGRSWPVGRYLRTKIREKLGFKETGAQEGWQAQLKARTEEELLELCVSQGLLGLLKEEEATEETKVIKRVLGSDWKKLMIERRNAEINKNLELKEVLGKKRGRKL